MNHSSLFSFEESSVWDPKVVRKHLVISPDQLIKLNLIPGWTKVQNNQDSLRLDKDFSIESSQSNYSVNVTQNCLRIQNNTKLFNEQIENRKTILKANKIYGKRLTRSLSLFSINENYENLLNCKTLKQTFSLQNLCQLSDDSGINNLKDFICKNCSEKHFPSDFCNKNITLHKSIDSIKLSNQCQISHPESEKGEELFLNKEVNLETMELSHLPINIHSAVENASLQLGTVKDSNGILSTENAARSFDQIVKHVATECVNTDINVVLSNSTKNGSAVFSVENDAMILSDQLIKHVKEFENSDLHSETVQKSNVMLPADNIDFPSKTVKKENVAMSTTITTPCLSNIQEEQLKVLEKCPNADRILCERISNLNSSKNLINIISDSVSENSTTSLNIQEQEGLFPSNLLNINTYKPISNEYIITDVIPSEINVYKNDDAISFDKNNDLNLHELCPNKFIVEDIQAAKLSTANIVLETEHVVKNSGSNVELSDIDIRSEQRECYYKNDAAISVDKSNDLNLHELCPRKFIVEGIPSAKLSTTNVLETEHVVKNSGSNVELSDIDIRSESKDYKNDAAVDKSNDLNLHELYTLKSIGDIPVAKLPTSKIVLETEVKNSGSDIQLSNVGSEPTKPPVNNEASFSKKRKLESRNKRSKRLKSEEKQGNLKIRSIKKIGEISYSAEEVKSMLGILKELL